MRHQGLRRRFILLIFALFFVLFTAVATVLVRDYTSTFRTDLNERSRSFASLATGPIGSAFILFGESGSIRIDQQVGKFTDQNPDISGVTITDTKGNIKYQKGIVPSHVTMDTVSTFDTKSFTDAQGVVNEIAAPLIEDYGAHRYTVTYSISSQRLMNSINRIVITIITLSILVFLLAIIATYQLMNRFLLLPISTIATEARHISDGHYDRQIYLKRKDELGDLADAVNDMATSLKTDIAKLQETDRLKSEFMTITSHNLRTPLTVIKGYMDEIATMTVPAQLKAMLDAMAANVLRLDNFTQDVLTISMIESGGEKGMYDLGATGIKPFLNELGRNFGVMAAQKQQQFKLELNLGEEQVLLSKPRLRNALWNLLDNAHKFTPEKGTISLLAHAESNRIVLTVQDTGIGINKSEMPKLFTKFHRATGLLNYDYEGTGIGLYLTKLIILDHHGTITAESQEGKGTSFTIWLPIAKPEEGKAEAGNSPDDLPKGL